MSERSRVTVAGLQDFLSLEREWDGLSAGAGSPFLTHPWLAAWWRAYTPDSGACLALKAPDGSLRAGAVLRSEGGALSTAANDESGDWGFVAADPATRTEGWRELAGLRVPRLVLDGLPEDGPDPAPAQEALAAGGYRLVHEPGRASPLLRLPATGEELLASVSRNLRSQVRRRRRALEEEGGLILRVSGGGGRLERDLETVFEVEGSGWKSRTGTAILSNPSRHRLYREFGVAAAERGWLRLYFLELDGIPIAVDYGIAMEGRGFLLKTGFDERYGSLSPGLVLRAEVLNASIEEGLHSYDFLGGAESYKVRWASELRPRLTVRAYRGVRGNAAYAYRARIRPVLKGLRDLVVREVEPTPVR